MKHIKEIRRSHLRRLLEGYPTQRQFAEATDLSAAHISQMLNGARAVGDLVARRIEISLGLESGVMDREELPEQMDLESLLKQVLPSDKLKLLSDYDKLSKKHKEMVREMAAAYVSFESLEGAQGGATTPPAGADA